MRKFIISFLAICLVVSAVAQEKILLEIDDEKINVDEFLHIYKKNNTNEDAMTYDAMREYMELFINFKLKVHEAQQLGMDTTGSFIQELRGYRSQLAQPYLTDKSVEEELVVEAYERMKTDIRVSHILIKVDQTASPEDTLKAYNKAMGVYETLQAGGLFIKQAQENSDDESVAFNQGDLGYRTVFGLVYEFESMMYNTPVGEFSEPFRTRFGYHILKVTDKRPAKGKHKVAHIMMVVPQGSGSNLDKDAQKKIADIEEKIANGEEFADLAKEFSEDRRTAEDGGVLGWISVGGKMIKDFEDAVFALNEVGDISPILKTNYGYHLIKLIEVEEIKPFEEVKHDLKSKISNTARTSRSRESVIQKLLVEYNASQYPENRDLMYDIVTDSIFEGTWKVEEDANLTETLLSFKNQVYTQKDFADYLVKFNRKQNPQNIKTFVDASYKMFVNKMVIMYEEEILEEKYPAFKYLIKEYHDGILLFELTDQTVWSKAITDTAGLENFYSMHNGDYMWKHRYSVKNYTCKDAKISKKTQKYLSKGWDDQKIFAKINKKDSTALELTDQELCENGVKLVVDRLVTDNNIPEEEGYNVVIAGEGNNLTQIKVVGPSAKSLGEARGIITADYQNYLEARWLETLRNKYNVQLHEEVLKSIVE